MQRGSDLAVLGQAEALRAGRVHVVGLGGSGVRGIVPLLVARGATVSGSDKNDSPVLERFRRDGVECSVGHSDTNVGPDTDLLLISAAVTKDNPEVRAAERRSIQVVKYAQCLGLLMGEKTGIAVAGTHGKTTTSAMTSFVLMNAGCDPSYVIGGEHPALGGGSRSGKGEHFVAEACEFDRSFLNLRPRAAVVTNVDADHLDYFASLGEIQDAFREFAHLLPSDGFLVYNRDDPNSQFLPLSVQGDAQSFSLEPGKGDWWAERVTFAAGGSSFVLRGPRGIAAEVRLRVPGLHNVRNALACAAVTYWAGVSIERIVDGLARFEGVRRRFDILAEDPCLVVDDYAHHPTEVEAVIEGARQSFPGRQVVCVFQPHQYSRLRRLLEGFSDALKLADEVVVTQVYRARDSEDDVRSVRSQDLADRIRRKGTSALYAEEFERAIGQLEGIVEPEAVVLFLGAGDVTDLAQRFAKMVRNGQVALRDRLSLTQDGIEIKRGLPA